MKLQTSTCTSGPPRTSENLKPARIIPNGKVRHTAKKKFTNVYFVPSLFSCHKKWQLRYILEESSLA